VTNYSKTETTTTEYDRIDGLGMVVTKVTTVTEYEEHEPTIKPEGIPAPPVPDTFKPYVVPNTYNPHLYPNPNPECVWPAQNWQITCNTNAALVYDLDKARANRARTDA
jgi:hypothetical protein